MNIIDPTNIANIDVFSRSFQLSSIMARYYLSFSLCLSIFFSFLSNWREFILTQFHWMWLQCPSRANKYEFIEKSGFRIKRVALATTSSTPRLKANTSHHIVVSSPFIAGTPRTGTLTQYYGHPLLRTAFVPQHQRHPKSRSDHHEYVF